jgi:hypothetical protein
VLKINEEEIPAIGSPHLSYVEPDQALITPGLKQLGVSSRMLKRTPNGRTNLSGDFESQTSFPLLALNSSGGMSEISISASDIWSTRSQSVSDGFFRFTGRGLVRSVVVGQPDQKARSNAILSLWKRHKEKVKSSELFKISRTTPR